MLRIQSHFSFPLNDTIPLSINKIEEVIALICPFLIQQILIIREMTQKSKKKGEQKLIFLSRYQQVFPNNPTWGRIEYMIQTACTNVSIQLKRLYVVGSKNMESKFNTINHNKTEFQAILSENQLNKSEDFSSISEKGFKFPLNFYYGKLDLKNMIKQAEDYYEVMICRIAVGKTYIFPAKNITDTVPYEEKPELMTNDFDSVCIYDQSLTAKEFKQNYIIYEPQTKCLPEFVVHFEIKASRYRELQEQIICELCEDNTARKYCETEDAYFCISCDNSHHHNRLSYKHKRSQLTEKPKTLSPCPNHPTLKMEIYCMQCNRTLCIDCKVKGDHSSGENLMHNLARITQKYHETSKKLQEIDNQLEKKKKNLLRSIGIVQNKLKQINKKNDELQNKIYQIMQESLRKLQKITKKKMSLLMSDHIELKRQLDQIQWMQKYLRYEHEVLSPNDFLLSFSRYESCKKDLLSKNFEVSNVMPDMRVEGYVNVLTEEQSRMQTGETNAKKTEKKDLQSKFGLFEKNQSQSGNVMKSRIPLNEPIDQVKDQIIKSKNNLLNLSILKHF